MLYCTVRSGFRLEERKGERAEKGRDLWMLRGLECVSQERGDRLFPQQLIPGGIKDSGPEGRERKFRERVFPVFSKALRLIILS